MKSTMEMSRREIEKYNTMRKTFSKGKIPVWMLNPIIIQEHNQGQPQVAQLDMLDTVALDRLSMFLSSDIDAGVKARSFFKHMNKTAHHDEPLSQEDLVAKCSRSERSQDIMEALK